MTKETYNKKMQEASKDEAFMERTLKCADDFKYVDREESEKEQPRKNRLLFFVLFDFNLVSIR